MAERKTLSKKIRFEVFKRDHFTCQYCGRMSPDVILEVDHINPVSKGGENEILNLITSCRDCNRGKGKTLLSQNDTLKKSQKQLLEMAEKTEQAQMMIDWKNEMLQIREQEVESIENLICSITGYNLTDHGKTIISKLLAQFNYMLVWDAVEIAFYKYFKEYVDDYATSKSFTFALSKVGGICYNKQKGGEVNGAL